MRWSLPHRRVSYFDALGAKTVGISLNIFNQQVKIKREFLAFAKTATVVGFKYRILNMFCCIDHPDHHLLHHVHQY